MNISNEINTELNNLFDFKAFRNSRDYRNNCWFVDQNWKTLVLDYFDLEEDIFKAKKLFGLFSDIIYLTSMPFNKENLEGKSFNSGLDFLEEMSADDTFRELNFYPWTVFNENLDIILIYEVDHEAFYLGYHKKHEELIQKQIVKTDLVLPFDDYIRHAEHLNKLFGKG